MCDVIFTSPDLEECRKRIEASLLLCKADLAPLESGEVRVGEKIKDGAWVDITDAAMAGYRRSIETLEVALKVLAP